MARSEKIKVILNRENFPNLVDKLADLTKISDTLKFKIDSEEILVYALVGETQILAFKNYILKTPDYITFNEDFDFTLDYVITSAKRFVKNLSFFDCDGNIKGSFMYKDNPTDDSSKLVRAFTLGDGRLKINDVGGEPYKIRDIGKEKLNTLLRPEDSNWSFKVNNKDFQDARKLASINGEDAIVTISTHENKVMFSEIGKWQLAVDDIDDSKNDITFPKKYLSSVNNEEDEINFNIFDTFILFKEGDKNLMISIEQTFD